MIKQNFDREYVREFIEREQTRRQSNKVLHGHPSPMLWKPLEESVELLLDERSGYGMNTEFEISFYVGTPFCIKTNPARCGFCLFPSEDYVGNRGIETYITYLKKEFELYKPYYRADSVKSIYFGGGTPNLYRPEHYSQVLQLADELYGGIPQGIEVTLEGIPQLFNEEKIKAISAAGFNRVSMGVQQMNQELIKYSGRRQTRKQVFSAIDLFHKYSLANNVDLIYGWPEQTVENMLQDLRDVVDAGVHHITHYELNVAGRSDFATPSKRSLLPTIEKNSEMYRIANEYMISAGFEQVTLYDWSRKAESTEQQRLGSLDFEHNLHNFAEENSGKVQTTRHMCGVGFSAINFHPNSLASDERSWIYMNQTSLKDYCRDLDDGKFPIGRGFMYNFRDIKIVWLFQTMQTMRINFVAYQSIFNENLLDAYAEIWNELEALNWIEVTDTELKFVDKGQYYIPMLQALIASKRVAQIRNESKRSISEIPVLVE